MISDILQTALEFVAEWCKKVNLNINPTFYMNLHGDYQAYYNYAASVWGKKAEWIKAGRKKAEWEKAKQKKAQNKLNNK